MNRADYLNGDVSFQAYYESIAASAGISFLENTKFLAKVRAALAAGDEHLNTIPLRIWDMKAIGAQRAISEALKKHDDWWSLAGGVCTMKAAAKRDAGV